MSKSFAKSMLSIASCLSSASLVFNCKGHEWAGPFLLICALCLQCLSIVYEISALQTWILYVWQWLQHTSVWQAKTDYINLLTLEYLKRQRRTYCFRMLGQCHYLVLSHAPWSCGKTLVPQLGFLAHWLIQTQALRHSLFLKVYSLQSFATSAASCTTFFVKPNKFLSLSSQGFLCLIYLRPCKVFYKCTKEKTLSAGLLDLTTASTCHTSLLTNSKGMMSGK